LSKYADSDVFVYGQEKTLETVNLAKMNLAVNGLRGEIKKANTYYEDAFGSFGASLTNVVTVCWIRAIHPQHCSLPKILFHDWLIIQTGYAVSMRERDLDTGGIAAAVFNCRRVIGSLAVIGPVNRMKRNGIQPGFRS